MEQKKSLTIKGKTLSGQGRNRMIEILILGLVVGGGFLLLPKDAQGAFTGQNSEFAASVDPQTLRDIDTLARTIWGEARGEGAQGMQAVANVVMNRYRQSQASLAKARRFGHTIEDVCKKPYQFSVWNVSDPNYSKIQSVNATDALYELALRIAERAVMGNLKDITGGADHYHTASISPSWSKGAQPLTQINSHVFYDLA